MENLWDSVCGFSPNLCFYSFKWTDSQNSKNNLKVYGRYFSNYPAGVSLQAISHFVQIFKKNEEGYFSKFDYGIMENIKRYSIYSY